MDGRLQRHVCRANGEPKSQNDREQFAWAMDEVKATLYRLPGMHLYLVGTGG